MNAFDLASLSFDAKDPLRLAGFWANALGWEVGDDRSGAVELVPTDGTRFSLVFRSSPDTQKLEKNRLHLDLTTSSRSDQAESVARLLALGARHIDIGQGQDEPHVVLADPEGNEFCMIEPENSFLAGCERLGSITCDGSPNVGYFWSVALGWPLVWDQDEETAIRAPDGTGPMITWGPPVQPKIGKNRLHLDIIPTSNDERAAGIDHLVALGATYADTGRGDSETVAMLDPDGNEFSILRP